MASMWWVSFHGGEQGINNILVYHDDGQPHIQSNLLSTGGASPPLRELRAFQLVDKWLYVVNAFQSYSQILVYEDKGADGYEFHRALTPASEHGAIRHPYDLAFDASGNSYVSSQDDNVVVGLDPVGNPLPLPSYLGVGFPPPNAFPKGTVVASAVGALPGAAVPRPPNVPAPQGLEVTVIDDNGVRRVRNSVRGVLCHKEHLYVADEPANAVKVYRLDTGALQGQIAGPNLSGPVQLLLQESTRMLYIGSKGNDSVVRLDLSGGAPNRVVAPETFIDGMTKHVSAIAFDSDGNFYAAERLARKIRRFSSDGRGMGADFLVELPDDPEFISHVPGH